MNAEDLVLQSENNITIYDENGITIEWKERIYEIITPIIVMLSAGGCVFASFLSE